jgi:uncharacterized membrane protein YdjX (TVP38/TMEM64 family)
MKRPSLKWIALALVSGMAVLLWASPLRQLFLDIDAAIAHFEMKGVSAGILFALAHIPATVLGFPGSILVIAGGAIFGVVWGTVWSVLGATVGAIAAFWLARYLLHDWVAQRFRHHPVLKRLNHTVRKQSLKCVFIIRFVPISPFSIVNFLFGLTPIALKPYTVGTFFGIIPGTLAYSWVGATGQQALHGENITGFLWALGLLAVLTLMPLIMRSPRNDK